MRGLRTLRALGLLLLASTAGCGSIASTAKDAGAHGGDAGTTPGDDGGVTSPDGSMPSDGGMASLPDGAPAPDGGRAPATWDSPGAIWDISTWN